MPRLNIDGREVEVAEGGSVLDAARRLGVDIPTLCYLERCGPLNSCLVCVVKVRQNGSSRVVPACGTRAVEGMVVESETEEVRGLRRTALELLLSDHVGDCLSPCHRICPLDLNIPRMIRQIEQGTMGEAVATVRQALPLPGVLGRLCHAPCEHGCRREACDGAASIRELERHVADAQRAVAVPWIPGCKPATGRRVAVVGSGPAGLAVVDYLLREGHSCVVLDRGGAPGGSLRDAAGLPAEVLEFELAQLVRMGAVFRLGEELGRTVSLGELEQHYDAVVVATGELAAGDAERLGMMASPTGLRTHAATGQTGSAKVFAAGSAVRPLKQVVRVMAEGRGVAECVHQFLVGLPLRSATKTFSSVMGRLDEVELKQFLGTASAAPRVTPSGPRGAGFTGPEAQCEAGRCLHCDCRAAGSCALQSYAALYGANPNRFPKQRRAFRQERHPANILFEPGKCILCGICVEIARQSAEPLGLTFVGRGFDVQVAAPLNEPFAAGLQRVAAECVAHCPTGAIVFARET